MTISQCQILLGCNPSACCMGQTSGDVAHSMLRESVVNMEGVSVVAQNISSQVATVLTILNISILSLINVAISYIIFFTSSYKDHK